LLETDNGTARDRFFFCQERLKGFLKLHVLFLLTSLMKHVSRTSNEVEPNNWTMVLNKPLIRNCFQNMLLFHKPKGSPIKRLFCYDFLFVATKMVPGCVCVTMLHHLYFRTILSIFMKFGMHGFEAIPKSQLKTSCSSYNRHRFASLELLLFKLWSWNCL
jgi:hypothetical protein